MNKIDRISNLPDPILQHILSFLSTKEAVRTGALARRWVDLWASLPSLVLDSKGSESNFEQFVHRIFRIRGSVHLGSFKISCNAEPEMLRKWLLYVVKLQPRSLSVASSILPIALPGSVFRCKSLEELELYVPNYTEIEPMPVLRPRSVSFCRLKRLEICAAVRLQDEFMDKLFSSCALLEELRLARCKLELSTISSDVLRRLVVGGCDLSEIVTVRTPNLLSLEFYGTLDGFKFKDMKSLVRAKIDCSCFLDEHEYLWGDPFDDADVLQALSNVTHLELHGDAVLAFLQKEVLYCPIFENLTTLYCWTDDTFYPIAGFLGRTPNLEMLTLYYTECMTSSGRCDDYYDSYPLTPSFWCPHLEKIEIKGADKYDAAKLVQEILASNKIPQTKINFA